MREGRERRSRDNTQWRDKREETEKRETERKR